MIRPTLRSLIAGLALLLSGGAAIAGELNDSNGLALHGFDPVAYFTDHKPTKGFPNFTVTHDGLVYEFASQAHLDAFKANPVKYVPQFGGFCAFAASGGFNEDHKGYKADVDPHAFAVINDKLYVNFNEDVRDLLVKEQATRLGRAESNWPKTKDQTEVIR